MNRLSNQISQSISSSTIDPINYSIIFSKLGILVTIFAFTYFETIVSFIKTWSCRDDYLHGFIVPFFSLYLIWVNKEKLKNISIQPNILSGSVLTISGLLILFFGKIGSIIMIQQISILIILPGIILMLLGRLYLKALVLPLSYLIFMIPSILDIAIGKLHLPAQMFSSAVAANILKLMNIPVFHYDTFIELPNITLEVANSCSGVRYLISIIAVGIPLAYFTQNSFYRKALLVVSGCLIGIIMNPIRIIFIGLWAYNGGEVTHGPLHIFQGLFISVMGYIFLFILARIFADLPIKKSYRSMNRKNIIQNKFSINVKKFNKSWATLLLILFAFTYLLYFYKTDRVFIKVPLCELPYMIGEWEGKDIHDQLKLVDILNPDERIIRAYRNSAGTEIKIQIAYFEKQQQGKELIYYPLQNLYDNSEDISIRTDVHGFLKINKSHLKKENQDYLVLYWYNINGKIINDNYKAKLMTAVNGLFNKRSNGAVIMIYSKIKDFDDINVTLSHQINFINALNPVLQKHFL